MSIDLSSEVFKGDFVVDLGSLSLLQLKFAGAHLLGRFESFDLIVLDLFFELLNMRLRLFIH